MAGYRLGNLHYPAAPAHDAGTCGRAAAAPAVAESAFASRDLRPGLPARALRGREGGREDHSSESFKLQR